jgi:hypothetical protein
MTGKIVVRIHRVFSSQDDLALMNQDGAEGMIALFPGADCQGKGLPDKWFMICCGDSLFAGWQRFIGSADGPGSQAEKKDR